jgi:ribosomal protein S18 acetylase RimI-like enzyme
MESPDPPALCLRLATDADRDVIARIWHVSAGLPEVGVPRLPDLATLRARVDAECAAGWEVTLAERGGATLGFLAIRPKDRLLSELFLWPDCRGQGIGARLLAHAKARMPGGFRLFTRPSNVPAIGFYEAAGLTLSHEDIHPTFGDRILWYRWTPGAP